MVSNNLSLLPSRIIEMLVVSNEFHIFEKNKKWTFFGMQKFSEVVKYPYNCKKFNAFLKKKLWNIKVCYINLKKKLLWIKGRVQLQKSGV